jgi:TatA/E family protein of Tat protein translocase
MPGLAEIVTILMVVLIVFGASKLPEIANSIGKSIEKLRSQAAPSEETSAPPTTKEHPSIPPASIRKE